MASTQFNVSGFTSTIKTLGLASPNKFKVDITFPEKIYQDYNTACPFTFEFPEYATIQEQKENCYMNIYFPYFPTFTFFNSPHIWAGRRGASFTPWMADIFNFHLFSLFPYSFK